MKRPFFKATIEGRELVRKTGAIRMPTRFRIRIYEDGEVVITTRGNICDGVEGTDDIKNGSDERRKKLLEQFRDRLGKLARESQNKARVVKKVCAGAAS